MKTVASISGGQTSAYMAANYSFDYYLFSLVRTMDKSCIYPDKKIRAQVEDRIEAPFIGTLEDDQIIKTMFDLEQFLGKPISWVSGIPFENVIEQKGGWLPNKLHRYCTTWLKIDPMFHWWYKKFKKPIRMGIGFRANEGKRVLNTLKKLDKNGLLTYKATIKKDHNNRNIWFEKAWQAPYYPLYNEGIYRDRIVNYWKKKPVEFAIKNNCVHCFHQNPMLLRKQFEQHPNKLIWASKQEGGTNGYWRSDVSYKRIIEHKLQTSINFNDFQGCDSGYCGI